VSRLVRAACEAAAVVFRAAAPALTDVATVQAPPEAAATYPAMAILPERFTLEVCADEEVLDDDGEPIVLGGTNALMEVASLRGSVRLWLAARNPAERARLEERITAAFFDDGFAPGRLLVELDNVEVLDVATGASWPVAFQLRTSEWREEMVFSERRWAFLQVDVDVPVLVFRKDAALVTTLVAALTTDLTTTLTDPDDVASPPLTDLDQVTVADDGTVGPAYP
jgi:hypothetical protein